MNQEEAAKLLEKKLYFEGRTAHTYIRAKGLCEYCGRDLIFDRLGYACAQIDHLLPRAMCPQDITDKLENYVLSCSLCNGLKRDAPMLEPGEDPNTMLEKKREQLITRAKHIIEERLKAPDENWHQTKEIFVELGIDRSK